MEFSDEETGLSVALEADTSDGQPRKRARRLSSATTGAVDMAEQPPGLSSRPTDAERAEAEKIISAMRDIKVSPPILEKKARTEPKVVACALALYFGQTFASEKAAKDAFGIGKSTDVRACWVETKLRRLKCYAPAALEAAASIFKPDVGRPESEEEAGEELMEDPAVADPDAEDPAAAATTAIIVPDDDKVCAELSQRLTAPARAHAARWLADYNKELADYNEDELHEVGKDDLPMIFNDTVREMRAAEREAEWERKEMEQELKRTRAERDSEREEAASEKEEGDRLADLADQWQQRYDEAEQRHKLEVAELKGRVAALHNLLLGRIISPSPDSGEATGAMGEDGEEWALLAHPE